MTHLNAAQRILAEKTVCILLVRGTDSQGERMYAYVAVRADMLDAFMKAQSSETFHPQDHGIILASGPGEPPEDVRDRMTREYGFNHEQMLDIPDPEAAQNIMGNVKNIKIGNGPAPESQG